MYVVSPHDTYFTNFAAHEIFDGVDEIMFRYCGALEGSPPSFEVAWTANDEAMVTVVDPHQVVITPDSAFASNSYVDRADNRAFRLNIFEWLCSGPVSTESKSWSDVKGLFR